MVCSILTSTAAWGQWKTTPADCFGAYLSHPIFGGQNIIPSATTTMLLPARALNISPAMQAGDYLTEWDVFKGENHVNRFWRCSGPASAFNTIAPQDTLSIFGSKPTATFADTLVGTKDGYHVFTTNELLGSGIGYIIRWKAVMNVSNDIAGNFVTPTGGWPDGSNSSVSFGSGIYLNYIFYAPTKPESIVYPEMVNLGGAGGFFNARSIFSEPGNPIHNILDTLPPAWVMFYYYSQVEVRYLLVKDVMTVASELDAMHSVITPTLIHLHPGPDGFVRHTAYIQQPLTINLKPFGTCTTPSLTVPFGSISETDLPAPGLATTPARTFDLVLKNCPRVNITYFFRSPNGIAVDNATGVVDLDSTPGNAQGVGVQLAHNGGFAGNAPVQFHQDGNTTVYTRTPAMGQNSSTGITHTIPMRATVYRTSAAPVVPGKVNASVLVYIQYP